LLARLPFACSPVRPAVRASARRRPRDAVIHAQRTVRMPPEFASINGLASATSHESTARCFLVIAAKTAVLIWNRWFFPRRSQAQEAPDPDWAILRTPGLSVTRLSTGPQEQPGLLGWRLAPVQYSVHKLGKTRFSCQRRVHRTLLQWVRAAPKWLDKPARLSCGRDKSEQ
jgi:hypothetical protein